MPCRGVELARITRVDLYCDLGSDNFLLEGPALANGILATSLDSSWMVTLKDSFLTQFSSYNFIMVTLKEIFDLFNGCCLTHISNPSSDYSKLIFHRPAGSFHSNFVKKSLHYPPPLLFEKKYYSFLLLITL
jgi:hypothetical protein